MITPLPFGGGDGGGATTCFECCVFCSSVFSVRKKNIFETRWGVFSLTELTDLTEPFGACFDSTERLRHTETTEASPPAPLRMERGVICEVTPISLLMIEDGLLNIWRTCRGISVITPLSIRRGAGGEASVGLRHTDNTERYCYRRR